MKSWLSNGDLQKVVVTEKSLNDLLRLIEHDLKDCQVEGLSGDRRFATAYGAALNLASYAIRKQGYRVAGKVGHHKITFIGPLLSPSTVYLIAVLFSFNSQD